MNPPSSSSSLQEGDGVRKSGSIVLIGAGSSKKKGQQSAYAVLSDRALELHESEKAQRKRKGIRTIVDLAKCFNVSQQNCPKSRVPCVCLLLPDECFLFRGENVKETADWFCSLLSAVISARALHLGRPVFSNEFFECVWEVTALTGQPKLKRIPAPPNSAEFADSPNICAKYAHMAGRKRLCFYPHTIILCKPGIEPAHSGLPKSGIPPFRTADFVEFSRHFIAQYGSVEKYFFMRIGRSSPMGSCELWVQCDSEDWALEVHTRLQDIIRRETEKKQQALMAIRGQQQRHGHAETQRGAAQQLQLQPTSSAYCPHYVPSPSSMAIVGAGPGACKPTDLLVHSETLLSDHPPVEQLETISEDEQPPQQQKAEEETEKEARRQQQQQSRVRQKRMELRECKAKVDSLEEEEQRFQQHQRQQQQQHEAAKAATAASWTKRGAFGSKSVDPDLCRVVPPSSSFCSAAFARPAFVVGGPPTGGYQIRRRGSTGSGMAEKLTDEQQMAQMDMNLRERRPFGACDAGVGRLWAQMDKADSLMSLGYRPEEETEDSGGTLRVPCDQESRNPSRSTSALNLSAMAAGHHHPPPQAVTSSTSSASAASSPGILSGHLMQTYVEFHANADDPESTSAEEDTVNNNNNDDDDVDGYSNGSGKDLVSGDGASAASHQQTPQQQEAQPPQQRRRTTSDETRGQQQRQIDLALVRRRRRQQQMAVAAAAATDSSNGGSMDGTEADQSCCSSSVASSSQEDAPTLPGPSDSIAAKQPERQRIQQPTAALDQQQPQPDYICMAVADKVSCSSDSFSHLAVPHQWENRVNNNNNCPEEVCSYTSDSGDSGCYSSMMNGQFNPRAFSFSSTTSSTAGGNFAHRYGSGSGGLRAMNATEHPAAAKWTSFNNRNAQHLYHQQQHPVHYSPGGHPLAGGPHHQSHSHSHSHHHHHHGQMGDIPQQQKSVSCGSQLESSSSSRFSMETSLITPLEEDERQVSFAGVDEEQRDRLDGPLLPSHGGEELRKRAFSLGSKSWITKPFRKLSSAHGTPSSSLYGRQRAVAAPGSDSTAGCGGGGSHSGSSSMVGSMHAELCGASSSVGSGSSNSGAQQQHPLEEGHARLCMSMSHSHRLGSSSSFASNSGAGGDVHGRSDSIGSSHSAAFSLPGAGRLLRKKLPSEEELKNDDLVLLEFMPSGRLSSTSTTFSTRSTHCVASGPGSAVDPFVKMLPTTALSRNRTNSCDEQNSGGHGHHQHNQQQHYHATGTSYAARGSAGALNNNNNGNGSNGGTCREKNHRQQQHTHNQHQSSSWTIAESSPHQQQQMRPSESFIRSIQSQQRELQKQSSRSRCSSSRSDYFPLQEVQCFIAPAEKEKIDAITSARAGSAGGDSLSLRSQRSGSGSCSHQFETIQELPSRTRSSDTAHLYSRLSVEKGNIRQQVAKEEDEYVLTEAKKPSTAKVNA